MAGRYNLTANDLAEAENYAELKELFVDIAGLQSEDVAASSLSGTVYFDVNNNGERDAAELAIANVEITLTGTTSSGQSVQETVRTEADGSYSFFGLAAGSYTITERQPAFVIDGLESVGSIGGTVQQDRFTIELSAGQDGTGYNFGERGREAKAIGIRSLFANTSNNGMISCVPATGGDDDWFTLMGDWDQYHFAQVTGNTSAVTVQARDVHGHDFRGGFSRTTTGLTVLTAEPAQFLVRLQGELTDLTAAAREESAAEGEGASLVFAAAAPGSTALGPLSRPQPERGSTDEAMADSLWLDELLGL